MGALAALLLMRPAVGEEAPERAAREMAGVVHTVLGPREPRSLGAVLPHEHVLVDFIGADKVSRDRYDAEEAFRAALPHLEELKKKGCGTLVECTPAFLGRDPLLLKRLSQASGLAILTNTGYYGAANDKFVPAHALRETADLLAARWVEEFRSGIEGSGIKPGFLKIGVDSGSLSEIDRKLVTAAARCHLRTGLAIGVHTGDGKAAMEIIELLERERVSPEAYIWIHAQNEKDRAIHLRACEKGAWLELDGVSASSLDEHVRAVSELTRKGHLKRLLVSQDAGWYNVGQERGGAYRGYAFLFESFLPALRKAGLTGAQIETLTVENPARAFTIGVKAAGTSPPPTQERSNP